MVTLKIYEEVNAVQWYSTETQKQDEQHMLTRFLLNGIGILTWSDISQINFFINN